MINLTCMITDQCYTFFGSSGIVYLKMMFNIRHLFVDFDRNPLILISHQNYIGIQMY